MYGPGADEILLRHEAKMGYIRYHSDPHGNVNFLLDNDGAVVEKYTNDVFGRPKIMGPGGEERASCHYNNRFLFQGREYMGEIGVYDYRNRFYHPELGRFLQVDPTGFDAGDMNLFRYCGDDPIDGSDPTGPQPPAPGLIDLPKDTLRAIWDAIQKEKAKVLDRNNWDKGSDGKKTLQQEYGALTGRDKGKLEAPLFIKGTRDGQDRRPVTDFTKHLTPERRKKLDHITHVHFNLPSKHYYQDAPAARTLRVPSGVGSTLDEGAQIFVPAAKGQGPGGYFRTNDGEHLLDKTGKYPVPGWP